VSGVFVIVGVGVTEAGALVMVTGGVTSPSSTSAWAVNSITVGNLSSGIKVGKGVQGCPEHPAAKKRSRARSGANQQRFIIEGSFPSVW